MTQQITSHNNSKQTGDLVRLDNSCPDTLTWWAEQYFKYEVTTVPSSQRAQQQDLTRFIMYMLKEEGTNERPRWSPLLSRSFQEYLRTVINVKTGRRQ